MDRRKGTIGIHTWNLHLKYYCCPQCGYIIENRDPYEYRMGNLEKEVECRRCGTAFTAVKPSSPKFGPVWD